MPSLKKKLTHQLELWVLTGQNRDWGRAILGPEHHGLRGLYRSQESDRGLAPQMPIETDKHQNTCVSF